MAYLQDNSGSATGATTLVVTLSGVKSGSTLVAFFVDANDIAGTGTVGVTDSAGSNWTQAGSYLRDGANTSSLSIWRTQNATAGTHTITFTPNLSATMAAFLVEVDGPVASVINGTPTGVTRTAPGAGTDAITAGSITTTVPNAILLCFCYDPNLHATFVPGTGATDSNSGIGSFLGGDGFNVQHQTVATAGAVTATWTDATNGAADTYDVMAVAIAPRVPAFAESSTSTLSIHPILDLGLTFIAVNLLCAPFIQVNPPVRNNDLLLVMQTHGPSINKFLNADTSHGTPKTLYKDVASPRVTVLQNQRVERDVVDTTRGTARVLLVGAPKTGPPFFVIQRYPSLPADTSHSTPKTLYADALRFRQDAPQHQVDRVRPVADTSRGMPTGLLAPPPPPGQAVAFAPWRYPWLPDDTTQGTPKTLYTASPRVAVLQNQPARPWLPDDTTQGTPLLLAGVQAPFQNAPAPVPPLYPGQPADTSQSAQALRSGDFLVPAFNPPQFQADPVRPVYDTSRGTPAEEIQPPIVNPPHLAPVRFWWQPCDSSQGTAKALYIDALRAVEPPAHLPPPRFWWQPVDASQATAKTLYADALAAIVPPPAYQIDRLRPVADTTQGSSIALTSAANPFVVLPQPAPPRFFWQPSDTSGATPKVLYGDLYRAAIPAPTLLVDAVRPVADTSHSSPLAALAAQAPFTAEPGLAPHRFWWQPPDTSQDTPKPLYRDALTPAIDAPQFQIDRVRPVVDTGSAEPKALYADQFKPVFDAPQYQIDPPRPVYDTSRGSAIEEIQPPLVNAPWFAPQRYPWLPADTSKSVAKALYADLYAAFFNPPLYQIDPVRSVYDTSRASPIELAQTPIANPPWFAPQRFWWQPADTSAATPKPLYSDLFAARVDAPQFVVDAIRPVADTSRSTPTVLIPVQAPFIAEPWCPPLRFFWQPADTSQSTPKVAYADLNRAIAPPPSYQVDRIRPVVDTSQSTPLAITAAPTPFHVLPQPAPTRYW